MEGAVTMGVQWGLWGDPGGFQLIGTTVFGSTFITRDNSEYLIAEAGVGVSHMMSDRLQLSGTLNFAGRYRKQITIAEGAYVSARYLFD